MSNVILGKNQYGKAEVRVVRVKRETDRHEIADLNVTSQLRGNFEEVHVTGDNAHCLPTDTQKNTVFAFAKKGIASPEDFLLGLADHFTSGWDWVDGGRWEAEQYTWDRILVDGEEHDHSFVRNGTETRTAVVVGDGNRRTVIGGLHSLTVLKSTGSEFVGYEKDKYTTLPEATDRILATDVAARWRFNTTDVDWNATYASVKALLLEGFAEKHSTALQQTLFQMGEKVLNAHPEIDELKFSMPNKHHFVVDLSPFGLENPNEVFFAADRPYGLIEATVHREGAQLDEKAWDGIAGFC
ncbi:factor-independent urate hydroxylase [Paramicrobacterium fandaimingii]|uniref:factor-independent urate hydroxylase n=1 Tax=Paramicrobacterium fandaimingii TaxID=2708079 RepID=UPI0014228C56|nr:urate oxidase [Microbacterium fandaimingii]